MCLLYTKYKKPIDKKLYSIEIKFTTSNAKTKIALHLFQSVLEVYLQKIIHVFIIT